MALAGEDMFGMKKQQKQWAEHKAMESCFGENMMKTSLLKMKKAVVKCTGQDMPELDLPMYKSPHRFVHAMLDSHQDLEQIKVMGALKSMQQMSGQQQQPAVQLVLGGQQQQVQQNDMFKKMMMKMMLKKMFNEDSSSPFGNMDSSSSDKFDMLKMLTQHMRNKRATDDIFELGDRLTEKLKSEQQKNASSIWQCLMRSPRARYRRPKPRNRCQRHGRISQKGRMGRIPRRMAQGTSHQGLPHMRHFCQLHSRLGLRRLPIR